MLLLRVPIGTHSWLTTYKEATADPLGKIWVTPKDYLAVTKGTPFDPQLRKGVTGYSRSKERQMLVESNIPKRSILE